MWLLSIPMSHTFFHSQLVFLRNSSHKMQNLFFCCVWRWAILVNFRLRIKNHMKPLHIRACDEWLILSDFPILGTIPLSSNFLFLCLSSNFLFLCLSSNFLFLCVCVCVCVCNYTIPSTSMSRVSSRRGGELHGEKFHPQNPLLPLPQKANCCGSFW